MAVVSDAGNSTHPELPPEWFEGFCGYCDTSHIVPCQDARESLGRRALVFLTEDYGEEFVKNLLRSHKV